MLVDVRKDCLQPILKYLKRIIPTLTVFVIMNVFTVKTTKPTFSFCHSDGQNLSMVQNVCHFFSPGIKSCLGNDTVQLIMTRYFFISYCRNIFGSPHLTCQHYECTAFAREREGEREGGREREREREGERERMTCRMHPYSRAQVFR